MDSPPPVTIMHRRASTLADAGLDNSRSVPQPLVPSTSNMAHAYTMSQGRVKTPPTPGQTGSAIPQNLLPSAPASPPTPAPSPRPHQRIPSWTTAGENEDDALRSSRAYFMTLNKDERQRFLAELLNMCDSQTLSFVHSFVAPRLKKDPFTYLPAELSWRVSAHAVTDICAHRLTNNL